MATTPGAGTVAPPRYLITGYVPTLWLTLLAMGLFAVVGVIFVIHFLRNRSQKWTLALTLGTLFMALGFAVRIGMTNDPYGLPLYIVTTLFTLLSPCAFLAHNYMLLPRLADWLEADDCLFLKPTLIAKLFVWMDVITFLIQAAGGGMTAIAGEIASVGSKIATAGLIIQLISFGIFCILSIVFSFKLRAKHPHKWSRRVATLDGARTISRRKDWRIIYVVLLFNCVLIMIRCVFRVIEFAEGYEGKLRTTEWYIYVFDTLPLFIAISFYALFWPPSILNFEQGNPFDGPPAHRTQQGQAVGMEEYRGHGKGFSSLDSSETALSNAPLRR